MGARPGGKGGDGGGVGALPGGVGGGDGGGVGALPGGKGGGEGGGRGALPGGKGDGEPSCACMAHLSSSLCLAPCSK